GMTPGELRLFGACEALGVFLPAPKVSDQGKVISGSDDNVQTHIVGLNLQVLLERRIAGLTETGIGRYQVVEQRSEPERVSMLKSVMSDFMADHQRKFSVVAHETHHAGR